MSDNGTIGLGWLLILVILCFVIGFGIGAAVISTQWCHELDYDIGGWDLFKGSYCYNEIEVEKIFPNAER